MITVRTEGNVGNNVIVFFAWLTIDHDHQLLPALPNHVCDMLAVGAEGKGPVVVGII